MTFDGAIILRKLYFMYIIWKVRHWLIQKELESLVLGRKYLVGKSGAWPKIFGWKVRCLAENNRLETRCFTENIWFEIRIIWDISGIINFGWWWPSAVRRPIFCDILYHSH